MILIVDDHRDTRRAMSMLLTRYGYEVGAADGGYAALEHLKKSMPHCVILDYNMPDMTGLDVLKAMRSDPHYDRVHVILFTAQDDPTLEAAAMSAGASAFVVKTTLDFAELERVISRFCKPQNSPQPCVTPKRDRNVG